MSIYDQIAEAAKRKPGYIDTTGMARPQGGPRPRFNPTPNLGSGSRRSTVTVPGGPRLKSWSELQAGAEEAQNDDGFNPLNAVGRGIAGGFNAVLNVADASRRLYQGVAGEIGDVVESIPGNTPLEAGVNALVGNPFQLRGLADENGERDTSFDLGEVRRSLTGDDAMSQGFLGRSTWDDDNLPGFLRPAVGFAGDLLTDPLTYLTAGTAGAVKSGGMAAARTTLAQEAALALAKKTGREVAPEIGERLVREAGTRGLGAYTSKGLARAGASADDLAKMGVNPDWGVRVGVGSKQVKLPGTAKLAQSAEDFKGVIKKATGSSKAGRLSRELFTSYKHGERALKQAIYSGAVDAPTAARGLALLGAAKGDSFRWLDSASNQLADIKVDGRTIRRLGDDESKALTHLVEAGDMSDPLVAEATAFFEKAAADLQALGVQFNTRAGYVPHRLSEQARKMLLAGDEDVKRIIDPAIDKPEIFQKVRQSDESIASINAEWRKTHDYDLLEDDFKTLVSQYMVEGQEAVLKSRMTGRMAEDLGLVTDLGKRVDSDKVYADIDKMAAVEAENIAASVSSRRQALSKAVGVRKRAAAKAAREADGFKKSLVKAETAVTKAQDNLSAAERKLFAQQENARLTADLAKSARASEKAAATRRATAAQQLADQAARNVDSARTQLDTAQNQLGRWAEDVRVSEATFNEAEAALTAARAERKALEEAPVAKDAVQAQQLADKAAVKEAEQAEKFAKAQSDTATAEMTTRWLAVDANRAADSLTAQMAEFDDWMKRVDSTKGRRSQGSPEQRAQRDEMRSLMEEVRTVLKSSDDPQVVEFAKLEAQAIKADAAAMMAGLDRGRLQSEFVAGIDLLSNPRFQKYVVDQTDSGMEVLKRNVGDDQQINSWYREAIEKQRSFSENPSAAFRGAQTVMRKYMGAMNWWKGWALSSPGFVLRNMYSGMFGMYLDDVSPVVASRFWTYLKRVEKDPEAAKAWAVRKYGAEKAAKLDEAHSVAAASGWGITANEAARDLSGNKISLNPLSANNPLSYGFRHLGQEGEAFLRGGHAYAVLERGGSVQDALQRVEKFHFNYRDISEFDRSAKLVMPFWTFWSRNIALQASVFAKKPQKLTRSYYNAKRNIEDGGGDFGVPVPWYLQNDMAGIATGLGSAEGRGEVFLTPDIPSARFPGQIAQLGDNPFGEVLSNTGPGIKIPAQLLANKDFFTGREYRNELTGYGSTGEVPRLAPSPLQLPGVRNVAAMLPGAELVDDKLLMQDNVEAAIEGLNPQIGRTARLFPNNERDQETWRQYWVNWLGAPLRWNDPGSQAGAAGAADKAAEAAAAKVQERIRLENLVRGG